MSRTGTRKAARERRFDRRACCAPAKLRQKKLRLPCRIIDISLGGARLEFHGYCYPLLKEHDLVLEMPAAYPVHVGVVWKGTNELGVKFEIETLRMAKRRDFLRYIARIAESYPSSGPLAR